MTSITGAFPAAGGLEMPCRNSYPIDRGKCSWIGEIGPAGYFIMEGRPRTCREQDWMLAQGQRSGECQRLRFDMYLSLSMGHSTSITNFSRENLFREAFSLIILSFTV